jgi:phage tail-like protein
VLAPASGLRQGHGGWRAPRAGHQWLESWCEVEGRFLWIEIELRGDGLRSPVLRVVEVEQPGHAWLQQLPALFSREAQAADFLRRYLAAPAQLLADLGLDAEQRHQLLSPQHSPAALLDWLAGLIGWALRPAWSERARRQLLQEAGAMAPRHGTPEVLRRIVEILAGMPVLLIEDFRLRAPGVIGAEPGQASAVLGGGIRLGAALLAEASSDTAAVERSAWRFTLLLQGEPDEQLLAQLRDAVERFKPAHTAFTLCSLESGLRVGRGLHLDLAALVGPDSGLPLPVLGSTRLGRDAVIGRSTAAGAAPCP